METQSILVTKDPGPELAESFGSNTYQPLPWTGHLISVLLYKVGLMVPICRVVVKVKSSNTWEMRGTVSDI